MFCLSIFFHLNVLVWETLTLIEANSLVVRAMGSQIYIPGTIHTRIEIFSFGSVTFSMFLQVFYHSACLVATIKLKNRKTYFCESWEC